MAGRHIDSLELALKARLLQRTARRLHVTDIGRAYYQRSRRILEEFEEAQREAGELQTSPQGSPGFTKDCSPRKLCGATDGGSPCPLYARLPWNAGASRGERPFHRCRTGGH